MRGILALPEEIFSRIAAGEVVERPASVVKEGVENSLDAGASEVKVSLFEGGKVRIVMEDDGEGISFGDLPLAVARHATSKIRSVEELERIATLGFRGEALAAISSVSRLEIRSRREGEEPGGLLKVEGGRTVLHTPVPCRKGTWISIEDLFYTLPARRKFLRSAAAEWRRAAALIRDFAVAYPSVSFSAFHDGKELFTSPGDGSRERVLRELWPEGEDLRSCQVSAAHLALECWWAPFPGKTRSQIAAFVNGRVVNDPLIRGTAGSLCRPWAGNWVFLFSIDPELMDANIHPAKAEVRFRFPGEVYDTIQQGVLRLSGGIPSLPSAGAPPFSPSATPSFGSGARPFQPERPRGFERAEGWSFREKDPAPSGGGLFARVGTEPPKIEEGLVRFLGQIRSGYLVFETADGLAVMDPHAAHERVGFERAERLSESQTTAQKCVVPLPAPPSLSESAREHREGLEEVGFSFDEQEGQLLLTAFPTLAGLKTDDPLRLLRAVLLEWTEDRRVPLKEVLWRKLATLACGLAVKLGDRMTASEALALWRNLLECRSPWSCPHGRPTVLSVTDKRLESYFGRE